MKVGILTAARTNNNGTDLQALAMQQMLGTIGIHTEIIDYKCKKLERSHKLIFHLSIRDIIKIPWRIYNNYNHYNFRKKYFVTSDLIYTESNIMNLDHDVIIVGSDQIWNLDITGDDINFFLPFQMKQTDKFSYAASFGKKDLQIFEDKFKITDYLEEFKGVSVREESAVKALNELGVQARHDLDPILMVDKKFWQSVIYKKTKRKRPYILLYLVEHNPEIINRTKTFAKKNKLDVIMISNTLRMINNVRIKRFVSVERWLAYMNNSEMIITNSYHGLSFSIALGKNFRFERLNKSIESNTRMIGLLNDLGLEEFVTERLDELGMDKPHWTKVNAILTKLRDESYMYLSSIFDKKGKSDV